MDTVFGRKHIMPEVSVVCRFGVEIKKLQRQSFVSSFSVSSTSRLILDYCA
jgi:hypothetical protein